MIDNKIAGPTVIQNAIKPILNRQISPASNRTAHKNSQNFITSADFLIKQPKQNLKEKQSRSLIKTSTSPQICQKSQNLSTTSYKAKQSKLTKQAKKTKQPIIRSYIIKQPNAEDGCELIYNCSIQHNKFVNMLNSCINKKSFTKCRKLEATSSFNNLKLKASLKKDCMNEFVTLQNPEISKEIAKKISKNHRPETASFSIPQTKNNPFTTKSFQKQWKHKNNLSTSKNEDYTQAKNRNSSNDPKDNLKLLNNKNSGWLASNIQKKSLNIDQFSNLFKTRTEERKCDDCPILNRNYKNLYSKQRKYKNKDKNNRKFDKKIADQSMTGSGVYDNQKNKLCFSNFYYSDFRFNKQSQNQTNQTNIFDMPITELYVFNQTPKKRKISSHLVSPEKPAQNEMQKNNSTREHLGNQNILTSNKQQCEVEEQFEQGNSCYLRTVNF